MEQHSIAPLRLVRPLRRFVPNAWTGAARDGCDARIGAPADGVGARATAHPHRSLAMRSSRAAVVSIAAVFSFAAVLPAQAGTRTHYFELINRAHDRLVALAIAPAGSDRFEPRPLGEAIDGGGDSATVEWVGEHCVYDLRFTFGNGRAVIYSDIDVCRNRSLRIQPLRPGRAAADGVAVDASPAAADSAPTP
ncbi:hypothetical protein IEQ11_25330 [Lysobacter capsici]|uniref:hypothetical protein n=1 Tax=Lysobacter capsici TaxID=435897 RepID=UPI00177C966D|nr:hypothetical protein [Lysobacter capsici]UOF14991.1 hypothetical protein IEQ11_25330 [Lysobacter capsici]